MRIEAMPKSDPVKVYASRFARKCLLDRICSPDHPVLAVERRLIAEAKESLHTHLLARSGWNRIDMESKIRKHASNRVASLAEDKLALDTVLSDIWAKSLDDAFPEIN
jgi:hypothetical protein